MYYRAYKLYVANMQYESDGSSAACEGQAVVR